MRLFHVSEEDAIDLFHPRTLPESWSYLGRNAVFAVSEDKLYNYLFPRDCPRISYQNIMNLNSKSNFSDIVIYIESHWISRIICTRLYLYEFDSARFHCIDEKAGYFVYMILKNLFLS